MCGWFSRASVLASRRNRWAKAGSRPTSGGRTFRATSRSSFTCRARYTAPIPPRPSVPRSSRSGNRRASSSNPGAENRGPPPVLAALNSPPLSKHRGQRPAGASSGRAAPHPGQAPGGGVTVGDSASEGDIGGRAVRDLSPTSYGTAGGGDAENAGAAKVFRPWPQASPPVRPPRSAREDRFGRNPGAAHRRGRLRPRTSYPRTYKFARNARSSSATSPGAATVSATSARSSSRNRPRSRRTACFTASSLIPNVAPRSA